MSRVPQYAYAQGGYFNKETDALDGLFDLALKQPEDIGRAMLRVIPLSMADFRLNPSDPASWRREGDLQVPVAGFVRGQFHLFRHHRAVPGGRVEHVPLIPASLTATVALNFTTTEVRVEEVTIRAGADPLTRVTLDAVPLTAMVGDLAVRQCLVSRLDKDYFPLSKMREDRVILDAYTRPAKHVAYSKDGRPPEPVITDVDGVPWWRVTVARRAPEVSKLGRRRKMTPTALEECWAAYQAAKAEGRPTTMAVEDWLDYPGSPPGYPSTKTAERWIRAARRHNEETR
jgi:hypothetical protein